MSIVCTSCGDPCDIETEDSRTAKVLDMAVKAERKACKNGGRGRHKAWRKKANKPVAKTKKFVCDACQTHFEDLTDADLVCPSCLSKDVWPDNEP